MSCSAIGRLRPRMDGGSPASGQPHAPEGQDDLSAVAAPERLSHPGGETVRRRALAWHAKMWPLLLDLRTRGLSNKQIADVSEASGHNYARAGGRIAFAHSSCARRLSRP